MSEASQTSTPPRRRGRYLALASLVPLAAAVAGAVPLAFPPRTISTRNLVAMAAGAENTGGFAFGADATVRADTALYTGLADAPAPPTDSLGPEHPIVYVVARIEDRWMVVSADPSVDCMDTTRLAVADSAGGVPREYSGRLERLPGSLARRIVAALNRRTPDLTDDARASDRWARRQLLPVMLASRGSAAHRARCLVRRRRHARRDSTETDSARMVPAANAAPSPRYGLPGRADLLSVVHGRGVDAALGWLDGVRAAAPDAPAVQEDELNAAGYSLLREGMTDEAVAVLRWTVEHYPRSANANDSAAEACEAAGQTDEAIVYSHRALGLVDRDRRLTAAFRDQVRRAAASRLSRLL